MQKLLFPLSITLPVAFKSRAMFKFVLRSSIVILFITLSMWLKPAAAERAAFTINSPIDAIDANPGDGICATIEEVCTLRAAIQESNASAGDDTITLPSGIYTLTIAGVDEDEAALGDLDIQGNLIIRGSGANTTIIDGNEVDRVFHITSDVVVSMSDLTLQNGRILNSGGGILNNLGQVTINNSIISNNAAYFGGGGVSNSGLMIINNSTISGNLAVFDGGGVSNYYGEMTINNSVISDNLADYSGGGIFNNEIMTINNSTIKGNSADQNGGGIYNTAYTHPDPKMTINNSTINSNSAKSGGGIYNDSRTSVTMNTSTISDNTARWSGGGIYNREILHLHSATIINNVADSEAEGSGNGGGIYDNLGEISIHNSIIAGNIDANPNVQYPDCFTQSAWNSEGYNLIQNGTGCILSDAAGDQIGVDPLLGPLQDNGGSTMTHALLEGSPAIDAGDPAGCDSGTDQRGYSRYQDGDGNTINTCDIGAYEQGDTMPIYIYLPSVMRSP